MYNLHTVSHDVITCHGQAAVTAFMAPAVTRIASRSSLKMEFANGLPGSLPPFENFDPFQLSASASEETIDWYRSAELKVGTNAMFIHTMAKISSALTPMY